MNGRITCHTSGKPGSRYCIHAGQREGNRRNRGCVRLGAPGICSRCTSRYRPMHPYMTCTKHARSRDANVPASLSPDVVVCVNERSNQRWLLYLCHRWSPLTSRYKHPWRAFAPGSRGVVFPLGSRVLLYMYYSRRTEQWLCVGTRNFTLRIYAIRRVRFTRSSFCCTTLVHPPATVGMCGTYSASGRHVSDRL